MDQQETAAKGTAEQKAFEKYMRPAWRGFVTWWLLAVVVAALAAFLASNGKAPWWTLALALIPVLVIVVKRNMLEFAVKHDEVTLEEGLFSKKSVEIGMPQIRSIEIHQTVFQRLLGVGDIMIASSGTEAYEIKIKGIENPKDVREMIQGFQRGTAQVNSN